MGRVDRSRLVLAAAFGVSVAIFSIVRGVLLASLPYNQPESFYGLRVTANRLPMLMPGLRRGRVLQQI